jgi:hypothetical protein
MGLDMYVFQAFEPRVYARKPVYEKYEVGDIHIPVGEAEQDAVRQLIPYCKKLAMREQFYDMDKIRSDLGFSEKSYIGVLGGDFIIVRDPNGDKTQEIQCADSYLVSTVNDFYVCDTREVMRWRKEYGLQAYFHEHLGNVENCGFYHLDEEFLNAFNRAYPHLCIDYGDGLFYEEWY